MDFLIGIPIEEVQSIEEIEEIDEIKDRKLEKVQSKLLPTAVLGDINRESVNEIENQMTSLDSDGSLQIRTLLHKGRTLRRESNNDSGINTDNYTNASVAPSPEVVELIQMAVDLSEPVSVGVVANYLCDKLREQDISKIKISGTNNSDESKEVEVDKEKLKSAIDDALADTDNE